MVGWSWLSYLLGVISGVAAVILSAFFGEAGKDLYAWSKHKIRPPAPKPLKVRMTFLPKNHSPDLFLWVSEADVAARLSEGYSYYCDPEDGARRFTYVNPAQAHAERRFFMWRPDMDKPKDAD